ncbi:MAG: 4-hydroxy-tetrahydrodipicolinate reductase [Betaproteobacteria bacterium]|nr:4-hydroxy-tetrahydrodipicolinate reductase [Betaproteobacteria bacterium]MDH3437509.1 4-hydroxy-tetrahydrodipicolinate reductase [Betaproteobacteria bacterium]
MATLRLVVAGASGRMGRALIDTVLRDAGLALAAALEVNGNPHVGSDAGGLAGSPCGVKITDDVAKALAGCDVLVDFTRPEGTMAHLAACRKQGVRLVIGTTGFSDAQKKNIAEAAREIPIALSPNFSVGVNVAFRLLEVAAKALGKGYDVEIVEAHHRHKVDAPSGTALRMGEVVAQALGRDLKQCAIFGREGVTGERKDETIGFATVRGGDLVGEHTVMFIGGGERVEIAHRASSRANFANGALRAARFLISRPSGLYDMADVLGFAKNV